MNSLRRKAKMEHYTIAETVASLQDAHPKEFQELADKAAAVYLALYHLTEPNRNGDGVGLIGGRVACWPMYRDRYTSQEQCLRIVSLCALTDALLTRKRTLPDALPFTILTRTMLYCGDGAGYTLPMLQTGIDQMTAEIESAAGGGSDVWESPAMIECSVAVNMADGVVDIDPKGMKRLCEKEGLRYISKGRRGKVHIQDWLAFIRRKQDIGKIDLLNPKMQNVIELVQAELKAKEKRERELKKYT